MNWYKDQIESSRKVVEAFKAIMTPENLKIARGCHEYINAERCPKCHQRLVPINPDYPECTCNK